MAFWQAKLDTLPQLPSVEQRQTFHAGAAGVRTIFILTAKLFSLRTCSRKKPIFKLPTSLEISLKHIFASFSQYWDNFHSPPLTCHPMATWPLFLLSSTLTLSGRCSRSDRPVLIAAVSVTLVTRDLRGDTSPLLWLRHGFEIDFTLYTQFYSRKLLPKTIWSRPNMPEVLGRSLPLPKPIESLLKGPTGANTCQTSVWDRHFWDDRILTETLDRFPWQAGYFVPCLMVQPSCCAEKTGVLYVYTPGDLLLLFCTLDIDSFCAFGTGNPVTAFLC